MTDTKNGFITAIGVVLSFGLTFITKWGMGGEGWAREDLGPGILMLTGIVSLVVSIFKVLLTKDIDWDKYKKAIYISVFGVATLILGVLWGFEFFEIFSSTAR